VTSSGATIAWVAPSNTGGISASGYQIWVNGLLVSTTTGSARSYVVTGQASGETHTAQVKVCNTAGCSPASTARSFTTRVAAPTGVSGVNLVSGIQVSWDSSSESALTGHRIYFKTSTATNWTEWTPGAADLSGSIITGLDTGVFWTLRVAAVDAAGEVSSGVVTVERPTPDYQEPPTGLEVTPASLSALLSWSAPEANGSSALTDYVVEFKPSSASSWLTFADGVSTNTAATVTGLDNGVSYDFRVRAANANGASTASSTASTTPRTVPGAPISVALLPSDGELLLSWSAPTDDGGTTLVGYLIEFREDSDTLWEVVSTTSSTSSLFHGLYNGETYHFRVSAYNVAGYGATTSVSGVPYTLPDAPENLAALAGHASATLSWDAPSYDGGSPVTSYVIKVDAGDGWSTAATVPASSADEYTHQLTSLDPGVLYEFQVAAVNAGGETDTLDTVSARPFTVPGAPTGVLTDAGAESLSISWSAPSSDGWSAVTGYTATVSPGGATCTTSGLSCSIPDLTPGTAYTVTVTATNAAGTGAASSSGLSSTATPYTLPGAPSGLYTVAGDTVADLYWSAPTEDGWSPVTDYVIQYSADNGLTWAPFDDGVSASTDTSRHDGVSGLLNGVVYRFRVAAVNAAGTGPFSTVDDTVVELSSGYSLVDWGNAALEDKTSVSVISSDAVTFCVEDRPALLESGSFVLVNGVTTGVGPGLGFPHMMFIDVLTNRVPYQVAGTAVYAPGNGTLLECFALLGSEASVALFPSPNGEARFSPGYAGFYQGSFPDYAEMYLVDAAIAAPYGPPSAPLNVSTIASSGEATVSWSVPATDNGLPVLYYEVASSPETQAGNPICVVAAAAPASCTVTGLTNGVDYTFDVYAVNAAGSSPPSSASSTPYTTPASPQYISVQGYNGGASLTWSPPSSDGGATITGYQVEICSVGCPNGSWSVHGIVPGTGANINGLTNGTVYYFRVAAVNAAGVGALAGPVADYPYTTPSAPTLTSVTPNHQQLVVGLTAGSTGGSPLLRYEYSLNDGAWVSSGGTATSFTITGLTNGTSYSVRVRAVSSRAGSSAASNNISGTPSWSAASVSCSGNCLTATVTDGGRTYTQFTFLGAGTFTVSNAGSDASVQYLIVGGGAGGATQIGNGAAGGSGGVVRNGTSSISATNYSVVVGSGGVGTNAWNVAGGSGGSSSFAGITANGGCGGFSSGCGAYYYSASGDQEYISGGLWVNWGGGGGAGAGGSGGSGQAGETGGTGGAGRLVWGNYYGAGGGGGGGSQGYTAAGGSGIGGAGRGYNAGGYGSDGTNYTGSGGGGGYSSAGRGGDGIVVIRVATTAP
jgi:titin